MSSHPTRLPRWAAIGALVVGAAVGVRAALDLDYDLGIAWIYALAAVGGLGVVGWTVDRVVRSPSAKVSRTATRAFRLSAVLLLLSAAQLPSLGWRLYAGDPEVRVAKAYVEGIAEATWTDLDEQGLLDGARDATVLPGEDDLPRFVHEHGIWFGARHGRAHAGFQRTRPGVVDRYTLDIEAGGWARTVERYDP